jgi:copper transport protein
VRLRSRLALTATTLLALPATAAAHASLVATGPPQGAVLPTPPPAVSVALDAPIERAFLRVEVDGPAHRRVSLDPERLPGDDQVAVARIAVGTPGVYEARWRVFSQDGHPSAGAFTFRVGPGPRPAPPAGDLPHADEGPLAVTARFLVLCGLLGLVGLAVGRFAIVGPAAAATGGPGAGAVEGAMGRWWAAWWALAGAAAVGLLLLPAALLRSLDEGAGGLGTLVLETRWGRAWMVEAAALVAAVLGAVVLRRSSAASAPAAAPAWGLALGLPPAVAALAISWSGHASSGSDRVIGIGADALHNWATGIWLGGLVVLLALVTTAARRLEREERVRLTARVVVRFSSVAIACVAVLVVTGTYRALAELGALSDLVDTGYGGALLVKLALFALLLVGGAYNRLVLHPRLERAAMGLDPDDRGAALRLRDSVSAELALAGCLMVAVAVLVSLPPPS